MKNRLSISGFTLIEVLVALAIVGGLLGTLLYTLQLHMSVAADTKALAEATTLAHELFEKKLIDGIERTVVEDEDMGNGYSYHYEVVQAEILEGLYEIRLVLTGNGQEVHVNAFYPKAGT